MTKLSAMYKNPRRISFKNSTSNGYKANVVQYIPLKSVNVSPMYFCTFRKSLHLNVVLQRLIDKLKKNSAKYLFRYYRRH